MPPPWAASPYAYSTASVVRPFLCTNLRNSQAHSRSRLILTHWRPCGRLPCDTPSAARQRIAWYDVCHSLVFYFSSWIQIFHKKLFSWVCVCTSSLYFAVKSEIQESDFRLLIYWATRQVAATFIKKSQCCKNPLSARYGNRAIVNVFFFQSKDDSRVLLVDILCCIYEYTVLWFKSPMWRALGDGNAPDEEEATSKWRASQRLCTVGALIS